ncbi:MAG: DUF1428 domain-containing protein [Flavobacteriales bacterium]
MARYADGFVIPIPKKNLAKYRRIATKSGKVWMEHGALAYYECVGDDLTPPGIVATFPRTVKVKAGETVVFSWVLYRSRAHRDSVMKKVMADPRLADMMDPKHPPFDMKRMVMGGFKVLVEG